MGSQDESRGKERRREQVRDVRWAVLQGRANEVPRYFSLKQIADQTVPPYTSTSCNLVRSMYCVSYIRTKLQYRRRCE